MPLRDAEARAGGIAPNVAPLRRGPTQPLPQEGESSGPGPIAITRGEGRTLIMGDFKRRTRTWSAAEEATHILEMLDHGKDIIEAEPAGPTCKVIRIKLCTWDAVPAAVTAIRSAEVQSELFAGKVRASRARKPEDLACTSAVGRGVRSLKEFLDTHDSVSQVEGHCTVGEESVWVSWNEFMSDALLMRRTLQGTWEVNAGAYARLGLQMGPETLLASLM